MTDMTEMTKRRRRLALFLVEVAIGLAYCVAFGYFVTRSQDFIEKRRLAGMIEKAGATQMSLPIEAGFAKGAAASGFLGTGWHAPEDWGVWSAAEHAWLVLPSFESPQGVKVTLDAQAFVTPDRHASVLLEVYCTTTLLASTKFDPSHSSAKIQFALPGRGCVDEKVNAVELVISEPASPKDVGVGEDPRKLGVALRSIRIEH